MTATAATTSARAARASRPGNGFGAILRIQLRTGWKALAIWVVALIGGYLATVASIDSLYDSPEALQGYDDTVASDPAMAAINGTPYGADTLGGVVSNEFGFIAAIAIPLMGLLLVVRQTRAQEEIGMLELLRSRGVGARAPWTAAVLLALVALALVGGGMATVLVAYGEPADAALLYGASIAGLGAVFAGIATLVGQLLRRSGSVTGVGILVLGVAYVTRAAGDVRDNGWKWLSPLAWQQETRPFADDARVWPLLLALGVAAVLIAAGLTLVGGRDLGSAMVASRPGPARAGGLTRSTWGLALRAHASAGAAWISGSIAVGVIFGAFTDDIAEAIAANPALSAVMGDGQATEAYVGITLMMLVLMAIGCLGQSLGRVRGEETGGRLEPTLARSVSRPGWLATHAVWMVVFPLLALLAGAAGLALTADGEVDDIVVSAVAYVPAVLVALGIAVALFGLLPRLTGLIWLVLGYIAFVAILGGTLDLPDWAMNLSPVSAIGTLPVDEVDATVEWLLVGIAVVLLAAGFVGLRRRDIPR
ncbi:ABC transporter permease [Microbacterium hominis]|uniref:Polyketide antibiotic transporter n=1 Tax=Microbacterium hominis TaxID=162426 RepID=A0A7D4TPI2_9MICO|nr:hypothetical protein [Microbacterium hominis]QKJ20382.1 hypothetical protein HQM25_14100 [Microbacterium hominis]